MTGYFSALARLWSVSFGLGVVALPIVLIPCRPLYDRGYASSKILGALFVTYGAWLASSLEIAPFGFGSALTSVLILAGASTVAFLLRRKEMTKLIVPRLRVMALTEALFVVFLALILLLIGFYPDVKPGSEGMMDIGILNSVSRTDYFPSKDVWMGGENMNYYYFGHVIAATVSKLCGMTPVAFYNPAKGLLFALFWLSVFALGFSMTGRASYGILALFLVGIAGNFDALLQLLAFYDPLSLEWFAASRIIPGTINEFPFFSLLWGDLHAYVLSFPLFATALSLLFCLNSRLFPSQRNVTHVKTPYGLIALLALSGGSLIVTNAWDFISMSAVLFIVVVSMLPQLKSNLAGRIGALAKVAAPVVVGAILLFLPFITSVSQKRPIGFVNTRTDFADFSVVFGILLAPILLEALVAIRRMRAGQGKARAPCPWVVLAFVIVCGFVAFGRPTWVLILMMVPMAILEHFYVSGTLLSQTEEERGEASLSRGKFFSVLVISGALIAFSCEMFYVDDVYGERLARMNTVFKLYLHVWILWGLAASYAIWVARRHLLRQLSPLARRASKVLLIFCLGAGALYPVLAPFSRTGLFSQPYTLDAEREFRNQYPQDAAAAKWLRENIQGQVVIAEATASAYDWPGRISAFTGHCAVVGWRGHEAGWRGEFSEPYNRSYQVGRLFRTADVEAAKQIISLFGIRLIYCGEVEREIYDDAGLRKFEQAFETIYDSGAVKVFDVARPMMTSEEAR